MISYVKSSSRQTSYRVLSYTTTSYGSTSGRCVYCRLASCRQSSYGHLLLGICKFSLGVVILLWVNLLWESFCRIISYCTGGRGFAMLFLSFQMHFSMYIMYVVCELMTIEGASGKLVGCAGLCESGRLQAGKRQTICLRAFGQFE